MWGRENSSSDVFLQRLVILLIFGFVLLQLVVFVIDAFRYSPEPHSVVELVHDTVFVTRYVPASTTSVKERRSYPSPAGPASGKTRVVAGDSVAGASVLPVKGDSEWKWDVVELNSADSAALDALPGIGGYFANQILRYRRRLGAFTDVWQLVEIRGMDSARVARIAPRVRIDSSSVQWMDLRTVSEDVLASHPYVGKVAARGIVRLRETLPEGELTLESIVENGILTEDGALRLGRYAGK